MNSRTTIGGGSTGPGLKMDCWASCRSRIPMARTEKQTAFVQANFRPGSRCDRGSDSRFRSSWTPVEFDEAWTAVVELMPMRSRS